MYLQPFLWYSGEGIIGLSDKNKISTLFDQSSTYNETVYGIPSPLPLSSRNTLLL